MSCGLREARRRAILARMGFPVVDAHVHLYPPEVNRDPAGWAAAHGERHWGVMCARIRRTTGRPVQAFPSVDELLRDMDAAGVARAVLLGWYWERRESCERQNRFYADCVRAHPDRLSAFATVHAGAGAAALDEARRARDEGFAGLGELSPHSQGVGAADERWTALLELAGELDMPVNLHVTDPWTGPYPGRVETPAEDFWAMARAWPKVRFILAHWGGRLWRARGGQGAAWPDNVWVDTAASPLLYGENADIWREGLAACGTGRVIWGTDYPLALYPRDPESATMRDFLAEARRMLPAEAVAAVAGGTVARLALRLRPA